LDLLGVRPVVCLLSRVKRENSSEEQAELKVEIVWEREAGFRPSLVASSSIVEADSGSLSVVSKTQPGRNWEGWVLVGVVDGCFG
jgi:hypothetical protein